VIGPYSKLSIRLGLRQCYKSGLTLEAGVVKCHFHLSKTCCTRKKTIS